MVGKDKRLIRFYELIVEMQDDMFHFAYSILKNVSQCEDAVSSAIIKAHNNLHQLRNEKVFRSWLLKIVRNECYALIKSQRRLSVLDEAVIESESRDLEREIDVRQAVMKLAPFHRETVILYYGCDYSVSEISSIMDVPAGTVKSRLSRARTELKNMLGDDYYE